MKTTKLFALALLSLVSAYGCAMSDEEDDTTPSEAATEDQLILGKGSVDNCGIVESTTMMLTGPTKLPPTDRNLDPYNQQDPFNIGANNGYARVFATNIAKFDKEDGKVDWTPEQTAKWTTRMGSGNYIVVDTSKPCDFNSPHTYLEIEKAQLTGKAHTTCGGRMPNEDAMDVTLNFLIRGPAASAEGEGSISDGVEQATKKSAGTFPYLAEMN